MLTRGLTLLPRGEARGDDTLTSCNLEIAVGVLRGNLSEDFTDDISIGYERVDIKSNLSGIEVHMTHAAILFGCNEVPEFDGRETEFFEISENRRWNWFAVREVGHRFFENCQKGGFTLFVNHGVLIRRTRTEDVRDGGRLSTGIALLLL
jgi:hypothetical protein